VIARANEDIERERGRADDVPPHPTVALRVIPVDIRLARAPPPAYYYRRRSRT
jgi:hypothetical protein